MHRPIAKHHGMRTKQGQAPISQTAASAVCFMLYCDNIPMYHYMGHPAVIEGEVLTFDMIVSGPHTSLSYQQLLQRRLNELEQNALWPILILSRTIWYLLHIYMCICIYLYENYLDYSPTCPPTSILNASTSCCYCCWLQSTNFFREVSKPTMYTCNAWDNMYHKRFLKHSLDVLARHMQETNPLLN